MSNVERKKLPFSSGEPGDLHYCQWIPEHPVAWLHIMHGMSEHAVRYAGFAEFLNQQGIMVTADDHRGHGETGKAMGNSYHIADSDGWNQMLDDQWQFINHIREDHSLPLILMGHSMGSFMATHLCQRYGQQLKDITDHKLCGLILSGSNYEPPSTWKIASCAARLERWRVGRDKPSSILEKMSFGAFNNAFKPARTASDWLSRDDAIVDLYIDDPLCGGPLTTQSWCDFLQGMGELSKPESMAKLDSELPVYLFSGALDPVGKAGVGVTALQTKLLESGVLKVDMQLYPGGRHETLNETNRRDVYQDVLTWLASLKSEV